MTKTSTSKTSVKLTNKNLLATECDSEQEINSFYNQIKKDLDQLIKEPQEATINNILNYSKQM